MVPVTNHVLNTIINEPAQINEPIRSIMKAIELNDAQSVEITLKENQDVASYVGSAMEDTLMHAAALFGALDVAEVLAQYGAPIDRQDLKGETPLHKVLIQMMGKPSLFESYVQIAAFLIEQYFELDGKDGKKRINIEDKEGRTVLNIVCDGVIAHDCIESGKHDWILLASFLMEHGGSLGKTQSIESLVTPESMRLVA